MSKNRIITEDPLQQVLFQGINSLTDAETLSLVIAGRNSINKAKELLTKVNYNYVDLAKMSYHELVNEGLTAGQATRVIACNSYSNRKASQVAEEKYQIKCSKDVFDIMSPLLTDLVHEEFWILFLNRSNKVIGKMKLSQGGISGTVTDVRLVMKKAIECLASGIIVCHNHPSGNLNPSESDSNITQKIKEAGKLMDIQLLDHVIISEKEHYSFANNGLL
ncbi:MAG: repair protein [candidate division TM6 bacterium GW2011_GWF2_33_332]|nr:MAG: repair protein [candidate division TM6 bacterium GW2011_GWF2_33_332]